MDIPSSINLGEKEGTLALGCRISKCIANAKDISLVYPDFSKEFEIYTDGVSTQIGAIITQKDWPLAFFSRNLIKCQKKYSVTKLELLSK